jgi:hypothetical protein
MCPEKHRSELLRSGNHHAVEHFHGFNGDVSPLAVCFSIAASRGVKVLECRPFLVGTMKPCPPYSGYSGACAVRLEGGHGFIVPTGCGRLLLPSCTRLFLDELLDQSGTPRQKQAARPGQCRAERLRAPDASWAHMARPESGTGHRAPGTGHRAPGTWEGLFSRLPPRLVSWWLPKRHSILPRSRPC